MNICFYRLEYLFMSLFAYIRWITNDYIKAFLVVSTEYIAKPCVPEEEFIILGKVDFFEFGKNRGIVCLCLQLFVDGVGNLLLQCHFPVMVTTRVV